MKRPFVFITAAFLLSALRRHSQTISFSAKDVQLTKIFSAIKSQAGYVFFYDAGLLREAKPVTMMFGLIYNFNKQLMPSGSRSSSQSSVGHLKPASV